MTKAKARPATSIRLSESERALIAAAAQERGLTMTAYIRMVALADAKKVKFKAAN